MKKLEVSNSKLLHTDEYIHLSKAVSLLSSEMERITLVSVLFYEKPFILHNILQFTEVLKSHPKLLCFVRSRDIRTSLPKKQASSGLEE